MTRRGASLIELLVAVAVAAAVGGLGLAAVQKARAAAARADCQHRLRQVALAAHAYHAGHGRLPPGVGGRQSDLPFATWATRLLPALGDQPGWAEAEADYRRQPSFSRPIPHRQLGRPVGGFVCPADGRAAGRTPEGLAVAFGHYLGVAGSDGLRRDGLLYLDSRVSWPDVTDGTSNTLLLGERPPSPDARFGWWYAGLGQGAPDAPDGRADLILPAREVRITFRTPTCPLGPYPYRAGRPDDPCAMFHFWSAHPGGPTSPWRTGRSGSCRTRPTPPCRPWPPGPAATGPNSPTDRRRLIWHHACRRRRSARPARVAAGGRGAGPGPRPGSGAGAGPCR